MDADRRILLVEDNKDLALGLRVNLEEQGYHVHVARTIREATAALRQTRPQVMILDIGLPDGDGLDLLRHVRRSDDDTAVLVLTAATQRDVKLLGLRGGADDYVTKPFDLAELLARVEILFRRVRPTAATAEQVMPAMLSFGDVEIDVPARVVRRGGVPLELSRMSFDLLATLARRRGTVVTRAELMRDVWGYGSDVSTRTLDTHIFELRRQLEPEPATPRHIRTVWRIGYRLE